MRWDHFQSGRFGDAYYGFDQEIHDRMIAEFVFNNIHNLRPGEEVTFARNEESIGEGWIVTRTFKEKTDE